MMSRCSLIHRSTLRSLGRSIRRVAEARGHPGPAALDGTVTIWYNPHMPYKDPEIRRVKANEYHQRWRERHPEWKERRKQLPSYGKLYGRRATEQAAAAHTAIRRAFRKGQFQRPSHCESCGREGFIEAAHSDYAAPLEVAWMCRPC